MSEEEEETTIPPPPTPPSPSINTTVTDKSDDSDSDKYIPIYVLTAIFGVIFAFGPLLVRKGPNKQIIRVCIMMSAFCIYTFWVTAYISQMNPLAGPRLHNTTVAWYQYKFGKKVATPKKYESGKDDDNSTLVLPEETEEGEQEIDEQPAERSQAERKSYRLKRGG